MLTNKKRWFALALVAAMLFASVSPATAHAEDAMVISAHNHGTLTVTSDLMDDKGVVTLENLNWDEIVIPGNLGATKVIMKNVIAEKVIVENGALCDIEISGGSIGTMEIAEQKTEELTLRDMAKLIASGMTKSEAQEAYQKEKQELAEKKAQTPAIALKNNAVVETLKVTGSDLKLAMDGFNGALVVEQTAKSGNAYGVMELELNNSKPAKVEISGGSQSSLMVTGTNSVITEAVVEGSANLVLDVETKKLETVKDSEGAALVVLAPVEEAVINGTATDITIASDVVVKKAVINGDDATVDGKGKLESAAVSNESADVKTEGTDVYDPAKATATPAPTKAPTAAPTTAPSYSGGGNSGGSSSGGGGSWYPPYVPTATPKPTVAPTPAVTPEVTPGVDEPEVPEEEVHVHTWNVDAATCVTAKKCTDPECGYVEEAATGLHVFSEEGVVTAPTCTEGGYTTYTCKYCTETKQDTITASVGHSVEKWTAGTVVEGETCVYTQAGTCTRTGCGATVTSETTVEKHNSELKVTIKTVATCQTAGTKVYTCPDCDKEISTESYKNAEAHKWEESSGAVAGVFNCTVEGCNATKTVVTMTEEGIATEELDTTTEVKVAGNSEGIVMSLDEKVLQQVKSTEGEAASSAALKLSADVLDENKKTEAVAGLSAEEKAQIGDAPIYDLNMSVNDGKVSEFSGNVTVRIPYELAEGEDPDSVVVWYLADGATTATSVQGKYHDGFVSFETNHFSYYTVVRMSPEARCKLFGHLMLSATTNPTCTEDGYITSICQRCGETEITPGEKATGHDIEEEVLEAADCQKKGKHRHKCKNKHCKYFFDFETPKGDHNPREKENGRHEASCLKDGYIEYECERGCGYHKNETIKAPGHKKGDNGKCTVCGVNVSCKHENHVLLVELAKGATSCLDGVICTKYCLECEKAVDEFTTNEHYAKALDFINLWPYGEDAAGYISLHGCACGETAPVFIENNQKGNVWQYTSEEGSDADGHYYIEERTCGNVVKQKKYRNISEDGCTVVRDVTWSLYVDGKLIDSISAEGVVESSHEFAQTGEMLTEGTCEDGIEYYFTCLKCGEKLGPNKTTGHISLVMETFDLSKYSEDACGGYVTYTNCPCGQNGGINYFNLKCDFSNNWQYNGTVDGKDSWTRTRTCNKCGIQMVDEYVFWQMENCKGTTEGQLTFIVDGKKVDSYTYSYIHDSHITTDVVELLDENSKSCLDGVNVHQHCENCDYESSYINYSHVVGVKKEIDLSKYDGSCGGEIQHFECACGESKGVSVSENHTMTYNTQWTTDENGMESYVQTARCSSCSFYYTNQWTIAKGENCSAVYNYVYKFYVNDKLVDTLSYSRNGVAHDTYCSEATLVTPGTSCEDGVTVVEKCRNCDYIWTGKQTYHTQVETEVIDLSEFGAECGGTIRVQSCPCGEEDNDVVILECDYGYDWDYILWYNYSGFEQTDKFDISRAEYNCAVTDPACDFKFAMEQHTELEVTDCRRDGKVYFCLDTDNDGIYETKYPVATYWQLSHETSGEPVVEYTTAADGTKLKVETRSCLDCGEYKSINTYADYLGTETYDYQIEIAWGVEGEMEYETWEYTFDEDCCSYTRIRSNDSGKYEVLETRPGCMADTWTNTMTCTQYSTGVCLKCGNENALNLRYNGSPRKHDFNYNSETGMYECTRCGMESVNGNNGTITLEDMSDDTTYIAGYWNGGEPWGNNEVVFSVFVFLHTTAEDILAEELTVTDTKIFDTGKVSLSKADVAAWAADNNITADYDVMFSFIPKNASVDTAYNITFTEE